MKRLSIILAIIGVCGGCGSGGSGEGGSGATAVDAYVTSSNVGSPLGINLAMLRYWTTQWIFVDIFKQSQPWLSQSATVWDTGQALDLDANGWVRSLQSGQYAGTTMFSGSAAGREPGGQYTFLYDGSGTFRFEWDASVVSSSPGQIIVNVVPKSGIHMQIRTTDPTNYVRNIRMIMPGYAGTYQTQPFHPSFISELSPFKVVRFMQLMSVINSGVTDWSQRPTPDWQTQANRNYGMAIEYAIQLANQLNADPWFCIPHQATDDYVTQFAAMVRDNLNPNLHAYIEYSNETWNYAYNEATYCQNQGLALGLSTDAFTANLRFTSQRSVQIFNICANVFGGTSRFIRILGAQCGNPWTSKTEMNWNNAYLSIDALAIAPYLSIKASSTNQAQLDASSVSDILSSLSGQIPTVMSSVAGHVANAASHGLPVIAYEGGIDCTNTGSASSDDTITNLFYNANRDPGMHDVVYSLHTQFRANGGRLFVSYCSTNPYTKGSSSAYKEYQDEATTSKYQALMDFIAANAQWW